MPPENTEVPVLVIADVSKRGWLLTLPGDSRGRLYADPRSILSFLEKCSTGIKRPIMRQESAASVASDADKCGVSELRTPLSEMDSDGFLLVDDVFAQEWQDVGPEDCFDPACLEDGLKTEEGEPGDFVVI